VSKELRDIKVAFTVHSPDNLPLKDGEQMYADDVEVGLRDAVQAAVTAWHAQRGHELVTHEPIVV